MPGTSYSKDRLGKVIKAPLGQKTYPKLPSLKVERFEPSNALFIEGWSTPSGVA